MTNRYKQAVIEDITAHGIEAAEQSNLLDLFEHAMKCKRSTRPPTPYGAGCCSASLRNGKSESIWLL
ncbi:MAG: hypothetical protein CO125_10475, partial [Hydrogenophilales bacterium CG_4_9_14_3_um_filter_59_35]